MVSSNLAIALTDLATKIKQDGQVEEAIKTYERALSHNPKVRLTKIQPLSLPFTSFTRIFSDVYEQLPM
jgi:tetratricopeptide (TPR) repeat protein